MRVRRSRLVLALLLLGALAPAPAQDDLVVDKVACPIAFVLHDRGAVREVLIDRGSALGVVLGWRGSVLAVRYDAEVDLNATALGRAEVTFVDEHAARLRVTLSDPEPGLKQGDVVELSLRVPRVAERSVLWALLRSNVLFRGTGHPEPYFSLSDLYAGETPEKVGAILDAMVERIRQSGRDYGDLDTLQQRIGKGRYKGRLPAELMIRATREELVVFLQFVLTYPGKYYGKTWNIDETYATWLINDAPYSAEELADLLAQSSAPEARRALLAEQAGEAADAVEKLFGRAEAAADRGDGAAARRLEAIAAECVETAALEGLRRKRLFTRAYVLAVTDNEASIRAYEEARAAYAAAGDLYGEGACVHNRAGRLRAAGRLFEALAGYLEAHALNGRAGRTAPSRGRTVFQVAEVLFDLGRFPEAQARYEEAAGLYRQGDALEGLTDALAGRAKTLVKLGRNREAAEVYEALRKEHARLGDREREVETVEKVGDQHWELGRYEEASEAYAQVLAYARETGDESEIARGLSNLGRLDFNRGRYAEARELQLQALRIYFRRGNSGQVAEALTDIGECEARLGRIAEAVANVRNALAIQKTLGNGVGAAYVLERLSAIHETAYDYEAARAALNEAIGFAAEASSLRGRLLRKRANLHALLKEYEAAFADAEAALALGVESKELGEQASIRLMTARLYGWQGDLLAAFTAARRALAQAEEIGNRPLAAESHDYLGSLHEQTFDWEKSRQERERARAIYADPSLNDPVRAGRVRLALAGLAVARGDFAVAAAEARAVVEEAVRVGAPDLEREARTKVADVLYAGGDLPGAREVYAGALESAAGNDWARAQLLASLAYVENELGNNARAVELQEEALGLYRRFRNDWGVMEALNNLAHMVRSQGDAAAARALQQQALGIAVEQGCVGARAALHGTAGEIELDLGNVTGARAHLEKALEFARRQGVPRATAEVLLLLARACILEGQRAAAAGDDPGPSRARAAACLDESLGLCRGIGMRLFEADVLAEQASLALDRGEPAAALAAVEASLPLARATGSANVLWKVHFTASRALEAKGDRSAALERRREAVAALDRMRVGVGSDEKAQRNFLRSRIRVYESMADLLGRAMEEETDAARRRALMEEALQFVGRSRFELLQDGARNVAGTGSPAVDSLLERIEKARRDAARLEKQIEEARASGNRDLERELTKVLATTLESLAELHDNLVAADPDFAARVKFNPAYLREVAALPEKARLLLLFPGEEKLYLWVYDRDGIVAWKQHAIPRSELYARVGEFRDLIDEVIAKVRDSKGRGFGPEAEANASNPEWYRQNCRRTREVLTELHRHLIAPVAAELAGADPLLVVPYGWLNYLPFEALLDDRGTFLGETTRVSYFVHFDHLRDSLARLRSAPSHGEEVWVAYADPVGRLKSALEEAGEVGALFAKHEVFTQASGNATEDSLFSLREDCTILHFATHGFLNGVQPADTYLELAPGAAEDGKLMQKEIWPRLQSRMPCLKKGSLRLVVLSACETARAANAPEAEVLGMPDKFCAVGSPAVVASLWSVYTWSTTDFMVEFYRRLTEERSGTASAMLAARRALLADRATGRFAHPYYWAPFLLFGDWR